VHVISRKRIREAIEEHPEWGSPLNSWLKITEKAEWDNFQDVKQSFSSASKVGGCVVFNIGGNNCRLISKIWYEDKTVLIRAILDHTEYDGGGWKNDCN
jgi:mRNA interferase HigB